MNSERIRSIMDKLSRLHQNLQRSNYQITELDKDSILKLITDLNILLKTTNGYPNAEENYRPPQIPEPQAEISLSEVIETTTPQENDIKYELTGSEKPISLNVNERVMFIDKLFNGDELAFDSCLGNLRSLASKEQALHYFNTVVEPELEKEGKDKEIVEELKLLIDRIFK